MPEKLLLIIRGAPGAGKTTIGQALLHAGLFDQQVEADQYYMKDGTYQWDPTKIYLAHKWCQEETEKFMQQGNSVIVSNTFVRNQDVTPYLELATHYGYKVQEMILMEIPFQNVHGVPQDKVEQKRMQLHNQIGYSGGWN